MIFDVSEHPPLFSLSEMRHVEYSNWSPETRGRSSCQFLIGPRGRSSCQFLIGPRGRSSCQPVIGQMSHRRISRQITGYFQRTVYIVCDRFSQFLTFTIKRKQNNTHVKAKRSPDRGHLIIRSQNVRPVKNVRPTGS